MIMNICLMIHHLGYIVVEYMLILLELVYLI